MSGQLGNFNSGSFTHQKDSSDKILVTERMTLVLQQDDNDHKSLNKSKTMNNIRVDENMIISGPVRYQQTLHVKYN